MPFLADISVPWIIVAMIFISFLRFVLEKIKGPGTLEEDLDQSPWPKPPPPPPSPARAPDRSQPRPAASAEEFRQLLETLWDEQRSDSPVPEDRPAVRPLPAPPPPPVYRPPVAPAKAAVRELSPEQREAAQAFRKHSRSPSASSKPSGAIQGSPSLATLLRDSTSLRNAVVLREILGPPLALQPRQDHSR